MSNAFEFQPWPKIGRLNKAMMTITEKVDGTNAQVNIQTDPALPDLTFITAGSRNRALHTVILKEGKFHDVRRVDVDNFGFGAWVIEEAEELLKLGQGRHYGEWWGQGIGRHYGQDGRFFSLFNARRWTAAYTAKLEGHETAFPNCVSVVPILHSGPFSHDDIQETMRLLQVNGSKIAPGFNAPEGIIVEFEKNLYKLTYENGDGKWKAAS